MRSKQKFQKKRATMPLQRTKMMTEKEINAKIRDNYVVMSEEEYHYLQQDRQHKPRLCCQRQFVIGMIIDQSQSNKYEYKMYNYPFVIENKQIILRTIVSFLNSEGGYIFIGIKQTSSKRRMVGGLILCQAEKQQIYKQIRALVTSIKPSILLSRKIQTLFVPIKLDSNGEYLSGRYIIKIQVEQGDPSQLYCICGQKGLFYYYRYHDQCVAIPKQQIQTQIIRRRGVSKYIFPAHKCLQPNIGKPIYESQNPTSSFYISKDVWKTKKFKIAIIFQSRLDALPKIKDFLRLNKVKFEYTVLGQKFNDNNNYRLQLSKDIEDLQALIESYGGKIIRKQERIIEPQNNQILPHSILVEKSHKKSLDTTQTEESNINQQIPINKQNNDCIIEGWSDQQDVQVSPQKLKQELHKIEQFIFKTRSDTIEQQNDRKFIPIAGKIKSSKKQKQGNGSNPNRNINILTQLRSKAVDYNIDY